MKTEKVIFFDAKPYDKSVFSPLAKEAKITIDFVEARLNMETVRAAKGYSAVCAFVNDDLNRRVVETLASYGVRVIAMRCAGFNNVDLSAACGKISIMRVPAYSPDAVAEFALTMMLCLNRKLHRAYSRVRDGNFSLDGLCGFDVHGKTVGIIGTGRIGRTFARLLTGFGVRKLYFDPFPDAAFAEKDGGKYADLKTIYRESDLISLHCPLTAENTHLIGKESIALMKPGVVLINTSRGKLIDTPALIRGLKKGVIGAAGLDVYEEEAGYFFEDRSGRAIQDDVLARLMTFPNVLLTSHQAFFTQEALHNIAVTTLQNLREFFDGKPLTNGICDKCVRPNCPGKISAGR